jgi:hypothetical protein
VSYDLQLIASRTESTRDIVTNHQEETMTRPIHDDHPDARRRRLLGAGAGAVALGALPGASVVHAQAPGAFDWKRFKGEKIEVFLVKSPRGDLLSKYHKEFEDMTGISVGSEMVPEQQQRQKAVIEFNSGNPSFDVIALSYHVQKRQFEKLGGVQSCDHCRPPSRCMNRASSVLANSGRQACQSPVNAGLISSYEHSFASDDFAVALAVSTS